MKSQNSFVALVVALIATPTMLRAETANVPQSSIVECKWQTGPTPASGSTYRIGPSEWQWWDVNAWKWHSLVNVLSPPLPPKAQF